MDATGTAEKTLAKQADDDWKQFLATRASEIAPGGLGRCARWHNGGRQERLASSRADQLAGQQRRVDLWWGTQLCACGVDHR
jgi:hypothetical protein